MSVEFETNIKESDLVEFKLYHNYHTVSGIAATAFGVICLVLFAMTLGQVNISYTLMTGFFGLWFTVYVPLSMKLKSKKQMKTQKIFSKPVKYTVTEDKIILSQEEVSEELLWEDIYRIKSTGRSLVLYITAVRANIIPYRCLGDKAEGFLDIAAKTLTPYQIKVNKKRIVDSCRQAVGK